MGTSPAGHAQFYHQAFAGLPAKRARVLVAGGADYSMLAHAIEACRAAGIEAEFTMADWCETPLALARWYAHRQSSTLRTVRRDLLEVGPDAQFDIVCTHAFLGHFRPLERERLVANLGRALRPGGLLFLVNRLRPDAADAPATFSAAQLDEFSDAVSRKAKEAGGLPGIAAEPLAAAARAYASRQISWPVRSQEEVRALFEYAGFAVEHLSCGPMAATAGAALNVPTVAGRADYARIVAVRRQ